MKRYVLMLMMLFPMLACAADMEGDYSVTGYDPYEKQSYTGTATFKKDQNNVLQASYVLMNGEKYQATGFVSGNTLSLTFQETAPRNMTGLVVYTISEDAFEGDWVLLNQFLLGHEKLTKKTQP